MGGGGSNSHDTQIAQSSASSNENVALHQKQAQVESARMQSEAVIQQSKYDYMARVYEADKNYEVQMRALDVREKEAKYEFQARMKEAQNDATRAEAALESAHAKTISAEAKQSREDRKSQRDQLRYGETQSQQQGSESNSAVSDYFYG